MGAPRTPPWNTLRAVCRHRSVKIGRRSTFVGRDRENGGCGVGKCRCRCRRRRRHPARHAPRHTFGVTSRPIHEKTGARAHTDDIIIRYTYIIIMWGRRARPATIKDRGADDRRHRRLRGGCARGRSTTVCTRGEFRERAQTFLNDFETRPRVTLRPSMCVRLTARVAIIHQIF
jgi:hypothetical protein